MDIWFDKYGFDGSMGSFQSQFYEKNSQNKYGNLVYWLLKHNNNTSSKILFAKTK